MSLRRIMSLYSRSKKQGGALLRSSGTADLKLPLCSHRETLIGANEGINAASSTKSHYDHLNCTFVRLYVYWGKATGTRGTTPGQGHRQGLTRLGRKSLPASGSHRLSARWKTGHPHEPSLQTQPSVSPTITRKTRFSLPYECVQLGHQ
jgi:hypothetical protein